MSPENISRGHIERNASKSTFNTHQKPEKIPVYNIIFKNFREQDLQESLMYAQVHGEGQDKPLTSKENEIHGFFVIPVQKPRRLCLGADDSFCFCLVSLNSGPYRRGCRCMGSGQHRNITSARLWSTVKALTGG